MGKNGGTDEEEGRGRGTGGLGCLAVRMPCGLDALWPCGLVAL